MKFSIDELPMEQFLLMGISKKELINLPPRTLNALLNGGRTSLMRFNNLKLNGMDFSMSLDAKLSLGRTPQGKPILKVHPINQAAKNIYNLNPDEIAYLEKKNNNFIQKTGKTLDGENTEMLICLDKTTNEFVAIDKSRIIAPEEINSITLTDSQKKILKTAKKLK